MRQHGKHQLLCVCGAVRILFSRMIPWFCLHAALLVAIGLYIALVSRLPAFSREKPGTRDIALQIDQVASGA